jgi:NlpC/P60 family putative phage cell wall peptidase
MGASLANDLGARVVAEARLWIGTPYVHQASTLGAGTDCLGLLRGVWRALLGEEPQVMPGYSPDWAEAEGREDLWAAAGRWLRAKPLDASAAGDVLLFRMREGAVAKHVGLQSVTGAEPRFIHAYAGHAVVESPLSEPWARKVVGRFAFPERKLI